MINSIRACSSAPKASPRSTTGGFHGPQAEIATNGTAGYIYGEALDTGWLSENREDPAAQAAFRKGDWNAYHIKAVGKSIKTWVNGVPVADLVDEKEQHALRLHRIAGPRHRERRGPVRSAVVQHPHQGPFQIAAPLLAHWWLNKGLVTVAPVRRGSCGGRCEPRKPPRRLSTKTARKMIALVTSG